MRGGDLRIEQGEVVALLGPNGAGKTSTIDIVLGLSRATDGQVQVLGHQPRQAVARGLVSAVMQTGGLPDRGRAVPVRGTVRNHLSSAIGKTGATNRVSAVRVAEENGWL